MSDETFKAVLDRWIAKQQPWDLQSAIYLLLKKNPEAKEREPINFDPKNDSKTETRAYTYALQAFRDPSVKLWDLAPDGAPKLSAADHLVHKRDFIDWADKTWGGDAKHLVTALKHYGNRDKKPSKTQLNQEARETPNRAAFDRVVKVRGKKAVRKLPYSKLWSAMHDEFKDPSQELYSESNLKIYKPKWLRESQ